MKTSIPHFIEWRKTMATGTRRYVGLDLAKRTMEVCILSDEEASLSMSGVKTDESGRKRLVKFLKQTDVVGMEACAYAFMLKRYLDKEVRCTVYILNPGKLQMIWKSTRKTDKDDARKIASFIQRYPEEELPLVAMPSEEEAELRKYVSMKGYLTKVRTSLINRLHAIYVQEGITDVKKSNLRTSAKRLEQQQELGESQKIFAEILEKELEITEEQLQKIDNEIKARVASNELAPYVMSIPGVGIGVAAAFLAYVGDGSRFSKASEVANYVGFVPRIDSSGETNRYGSITKTGCQALRGVIVQSAWSLLRCTENGGRLREKLFLMRERIGKTKSAVAIARKMVTLMWVLVRRKEFYADCKREQLEIKFRKYKLNYEGWESKSA